jgi:hypothetical protein
MNAGHTVASNGADGYPALAVFSEWASDEIRDRDLGIGAGY